MCDVNCLVKFLLEIKWRLEIHRKIHSTTEEMFSSNAVMFGLENDIDYRGWADLE